MHYFYVFDMVTNSNMDVIELTFSRVNYLVISHMCPMSLHTTTEYICNYIFSKI